MALTRVTSGVLGANAVSAEKLANGSISSRTLGNNSILLQHLSSSANFTTSINTVQSNVDVLQANINTVAANVGSVITNVNIVTANVRNVAANTIRNKANVDTALANVIQLNANIDAVQTNVVAAEANVAAVLDGTSPFTGAVTMQDTLTVQGNLVVVGAQVDLGIGSAQIDDATLLLAANTPPAQGLPTDAGILINRGANANVFFGFAQYGDHIDFIFTDAPANNTQHFAISYIDVHANSFGSDATHTPGFTGYHHADHPDTGMYFIPTEDKISFSTGGTNQANILSSGNIELTIGSIEQIDGNRIDLKRNSNIILNSTDSVKILLDVDNDDTASFLGIYSDTADETTDVESALVSIRDDGNVFVAHDINIVGNANVNSVNLLSNDYVTYTRLNANINVVSQNVDSGVGLVKKVNTAVSTGSSNVFYVATPTPTQIPSDLDKVNVFIDGVRQIPDDPGTSNNDFVYSSADASVTITDPNLPAGLNIIIDALCPRP